MKTEKNNVRILILSALLCRHTLLVLLAHLWDIIFSVVSPSVIVTLLLLMYAPL